VLQRVYRAERDIIFTISVCLTTYPSRGDAVSKRMHISSNFLHRLVGSSPYIFEPHALSLQSAKVTPLSGCVKYIGSRKCAIFDQNCCLSRGYWGSL